MRGSIKVGLSFGLTSGIITTLGLMIGLGVGTGLRLAVIGGIITIAVAYAFSDALGIHIAEESSKRNNERAIWEATITTFFVKLFVALSFIVPVLLFDLKMALAVSICWGLLLLITFNYFLARSRGDSPIRVIGEHVLIAIVVIILANYVGRMIGIWFG